MLTDAYANTLDTSALILSREAISDVTDIVGHAPVGGPPAGRPADSFGRWAPWVRQIAIVQELMQALRIDAANPPTEPPGAPPLRAACAVQCCGRPLVVIECPYQQEFIDQIPLVLAWAELRAERRDEILAQMTEPYAFLASVAGLRADRHRHTFQLLACAMQVAIQVDMRMKAEFACWRPGELSPQVQPMISTPGHGSFPSGHATEIFTAATVLRGLVEQAQAARPAAYHRALGAQLDRLAARIATNRVVAGVHFPVDSVAGRVLGMQLGRFVLRAAGLGPAPVSTASLRFAADDFFVAGGPPRDLSLDDAETSSYVLAGDDVPLAELAGHHALLRALAAEALREFAL